MTVHVPSLIERKRDGEALAPHEIAELIDRFTRGGIPDYQMSAFAISPEEHSTNWKAFQASTSSSMKPALSASSSRSAFS